MAIPATLQDIINKTRRITGRPNASQITDAQIVDYANQFYVYDFPEHLRLESLRVNYQFLTQANIPVYDLPTDVYLTTMPPVYIAGYQSYMTQSRDNFFRVNPFLKFLQQQVSTGTGVAGPYTFTLSSTPILQGYKPNPPGAYTGILTDVQPRFMNWNVLITAQGGVSPGGTPIWYSLVDDGFGNLVSLDDPGPDSVTPAYTVQGSINYVSGAVTVTQFVDSTLAPVVIPASNPINAQYTPYVASRPQSACFYQDQIMLFPIPDQVYTVSFEAFKYPFSFSETASPLTQYPQLSEWWELIALGAADKIFADNGDIENMSKFRPLLDEKMRLAQRRTIVQYASERVATIYTEQSQMQQFPFGNLFNGF